MKEYSLNNIENAKIIFKTKSKQITEKENRNEKGVLPGAYLAWPSTAQPTGLVPVVLYLCQ